MATELAAPPRAIEIVCPHDAGALVWDDAGITCPRCGRDWERSGSIPLFAPGRVAAAGAPAPPPNPEISQTAADWRFLVPLTAESRALVVGFGASSVALDLAAEVQAVAAVHTDLSALHAMEHHARELGVQNIVTAMAAGDDLPFPAADFDLLVLDPATLPPTGRERTARLRALRRKLRPGAHLFLPTANRWGRLFRENARPVPGSAPLGMGGWTRLLADSGFGRITFHAAFPDAEAPREILPLDDPAAFAWWLENRAIGTRRMPAAVWKQAFRAGIVPRLLPHFAVVARAGSSS